MYYRGIDCILYRILYKYHKGENPLFCILQSTSLYKTNEIKWVHQFQYKILKIPAIHNGIERIKTIYWWTPPNSFPGTTKFMFDLTKRFFFSFIFLGYLIYLY